MSLKKGLCLFFPRCYEVDNVISLSLSFLHGHLLDVICAKIIIIIANAEAWVPWAVKTTQDQHICYDFQSVSFILLWILSPPPKRWLCLDLIVWCQMQFIGGIEAFCRCLCFPGNVLCTVAACLNFCKCCVSISDLCFDLPTPGLRFFTILLYA